MMGWWMKIFQVINVNFIALCVTGIKYSFGAFEKDSKVFIRSICHLSGTSGSRLVYIFAICYYNMIYIVNESVRQQQQQQQQVQGASLGQALRQQQQQQSSGKKSTGNVFIKVHLYSTLEVKQTTTVYLPTDMLLSDVLVFVCRKRKIDPNDYTLKMADTKTDVPLDKTLESLGVIELCLLKKERGPSGKYICQCPSLKLMLMRKK